MDSHHGGGAQQAAELHHIAHNLTGGGDDADGSGLGVHHADGGLVCDDGREGLGGGVTGDSDHIQAHGAHAGHGFQLVQLESAHLGGGDHALVLTDGDEGTGQTTYVVGGHNAALLDGVVQQSQSGSGAVGAADLQAHFLQNAGHGIAHSGSGSQGQVHDAEGNTQTLGGLLGHQLTHTGDAEGGLFDGLGHHVKGLAGDLLQGVVDHAGAGDAHAHHGLGFTHTVEGAGHEGVVLHGVGEDHQLGAAEAAGVGGEGGGLLEDAAHLSHSIHVDARLGGAHVHGRAHHIGSGQGLGDGGDELPVRLGKALLHQGREAADEVDAHGLGSPVQGGGEGDVVAALAGSGHQRDRGHRDSLVDNGDAELPLDILAGGDQVLGPAADLVVDLLAGGFGIGVGAVQQGDAHGDGADIQVLPVEHVDGLEDFRGMDHTKSLLPQMRCMAAKVSSRWAWMDRPSSLPSWDRRSARSPKGRTDWLASTSRVMVKVSVRRMVWVMSRISTFRLASS